MRDSTPHDRRLTPGDVDELIGDDPPDLQEILLDLLTHTSARVRVRAALRLAEHFQDVRAVSTLAEAMSVPDWRTRRQAARALWEIGDADAPGLIRALHFEHGRVREAIAEALELAGWIPDDVDTEVAFRIATWNWQDIVRIGEPAVPGLISVLSDPDGTVRRGAAWALGQIGDARAVPWLIQALQDSAGGLLGIGERVCDVAAEALERIGTAEAVEAVRQWRRDQASGQATT